MTFWATLKGHENGCPCFGCVFLNAQLTREAVASVALDRDDRVQTMHGDDGIVRWDWQFLLVLVGLLVFIAVVSAVVW